MVVVTGAGASVVVVVGGAAAVVVVAGAGGAVVVVDKGARYRTRFECSSAPSTRDSLNERVTCP